MCFLIYLSYICIRFISHLIIYILHMADNIFKCSFEDIQEGDSVYWENKHLDSNQDVYWIVEEKDNKNQHLLVTPEMGVFDKFWISYNDVTHVQHKLEKTETDI